MNNKRGQVALEFLMTYGWAILVVLVVIGALAYFGVLSPTTFIPERCSLQVGLNCPGSKITTSDVTILVENAMGQDIEITGLNVSMGDNSCHSNSPGTGDTLLSGGSETLEVTGCGDFLDDHENRKIRLDVEIEYHTMNAPEFKLRSSGSIIGRVYED